MQRFDCNVCCGTPRHERGADAGDWHSADHGVEAVTAGSRRTGASMLLHGFNEQTCTAYVNPFWENLERGIAIAAKGNASKLPWTSGKLGIYEARSHFS